MIRQCAQSTSQLYAFMRKLPFLCLLAHTAICSTAFNSVRIAYFNLQDNRDPATNVPSISPAFLQRAKQDNYTHILVEYYVIDPSDWRNGRYVGGTQKVNYRAGKLFSFFRESIAAVRSVGLDFIPLIIVPGTCPGPYSIPAWWAALTPEMDIYAAQDQIPCIASGLTVPGSNGVDTLQGEGFDRSFRDAMEVIEAACEANVYDLQYINLGFSECAFHKPPFGPVWGTGKKGKGADTVSIDQKWMALNGNRDVSDLVAAVLERRIHNIRVDVGRRLASAEVMIYGDMFSSEFRRALHGFPISTTTFPSKSETKKLSDRLIIIPWWYESKRLDGKDFDTETMFREFTDNGLRIVYMSCITETDRQGKQALDALPSRIPQLFECINVAGVNKKNILGFASGHWDMTGYDDDICWNSMEFLAYGNRTARPQLRLVAIAPGKTDSVSVGRLLCSRTETIQAEYLAVTGKFPFHNNTSGDLSLPAENVTFFDAVLYCNLLSVAEGLDPVYSYDPVRKGDTAGGRCTILRRLNADTSKNGYRLLSPQEWKYVYKAGTSSTFFWGDDDAGRYCWNRANSGNTTRPTGKLLPNDWGLFDMAGNVEEWIGTLSHPIKAAVAGGAYVNHPGDARFGHAGVREEEHPGRCRKWLGFRVVRKAPHAAP